MMNVQPLPLVQVGGLRVGVLSRAAWAQRMVADCLARRGKQLPPLVSFSVNGQVVANAWRQPEYRAMLEQADYRDADGQPLVVMSRCLTRSPLPERVATTDFFHDACAAAEAAGLRFYLLGTTPENLAVAVARIRALYPKLQLVGTRHGFVQLEEEASVIEEILATQPDVLWVGMGVPRQENFALRNRKALAGIGWVKTCGGLFDYFTPQVKRAPRWMQQAGLEWLFRTIQEPKKYAWRYLTTNPLALWLLLTRTRDLA